MNRATLAVSSIIAVAAVVAAPAAHAATKPATAVARIAGTVLDEVIGFGVGAGLDALLGVSDTAPANLSEEAFGRIDSIVSNIVVNGRFADHKITVNQVVYDAKHYYRDADAALAYTTAKDIARRAGNAAVSMSTFGLRGVPGYGLMKSIEIAFIQEAAAAKNISGDLAGRDNELRNMRNIALGGLAHLDAMEEAWHTAQTSKYGLYRHQSRHHYDGWYQNLYQKACFDGPSGRVCSTDEWNCKVTWPKATFDNTLSDDHTCENSQAEYTDAYRKRSQQLALDHAEIFGADSSLRVQLAVVAEIADRFGTQTSVINHYIYNHGYRVGTHPRMLGDVDGDGNDDIVAIGNGAVSIALSNGSGGFGAPVASVANFAPNAGGWTAEHPRFMADINNDGYDDLVGFGGAGVYVGYSNGSGLGNPVLVFDNFGYDQGWRTTSHVRDVADVNGDGRPDLIAINDAGVFVALNSTGGFHRYTTWTTALTRNSGGWTVASYPRMLADVNGDGMADLVGFGYGGVAVALSDGQAFGTLSWWFTGFDYLRGWRVGVHERHMADVNGDGLADIVGFAQNGAHVALSSGTGFVSDGQWHAAYGAGQDWSAAHFPRALGDINGDGAADIVGFHRATTYSSLATFP